MRSAVLFLGFTSLGCAAMTAALSGVGTDAADAAGAAAADPGAWIWPWGTAAAGVGVAGYVFRGALSRLSAYLLSKARPRA